MAYQALYRKYRPQTFSDVFGQEHITKTLQSEVANEKIGHAYLFTGTRGTGKTTCAKILARAINCNNTKDGNPCGECDMCRMILSGEATDIVEIDAGDTYAYDSEGLTTQKAREDAAKERIFSLLPEDQKAELVALFDEFEDNKTAEAKFAHAMDNLQPLMLNNSNGGADWREHGVTKEQVYGRQSRTKEGSERLFELTDMIIRQHIERGNLRE